MITDNACIIQIWKQRSFNLMFSNVEKTIVYIGLLVKLAKSKNDNYVVCNV